MKQKFKKNLKIIIVCIVLALVALGVFALSKKEKNISLSEFNMLMTKDIKNAYISENMLYFSIDNTDYKIYANDNIVEKLLSKTNIDYKNEFDYSLILMFIVLCIFIYYLYYIRSISKQSSQAASNHPLNNLVKPEFRFVLDSDCDFSSVIGQEKAKKELKKLSTMFKHKNYPIKGVLLTGPSGVGKTMLAKALANEAKVSFLYQSASSFNEIFVGLGAKRVRQLFENAKKIAPCIVFVDEIDALGKQRGNALASDSENTLNELLTQLDGFSKLDNVLVLAATNRDDVLDNALLRRFDKKIRFLLPSYDDRLMFLEKIAQKGYVLDDLDFLAKITKGYSGASFKTLENELFISNEQLSKKELISLIQSIKHGLSEQKVLNDSEKQIQAIYQAGKITMARICDAKLVYADMFNLEYFFENEHIKSLSQIKNEIKILLSGVIANEMFMDENYDNFIADKEKIEELLKFYMEINLDKLNSECKDYLKAYEQEIKALANELIENDEIYF